MDTRPATVRLETTARFAATNASRLWPLHLKPNAHAIMPNVGTVTPERFFSRTLTEIRETRWCKAIFTTFVETSTIFSRQSVFIGE